MEQLRWVTMTDEEADELLGKGGTGTLSFSTATGEPPFSLPVSYGYDAETVSFYYRLAFPPNSGKAGLVDNLVSFVTHRKADAGWRSVVATGRLEEITDAPYESAVKQGMWAVSIPSVDIFDRPPEELTFRLFRLVPATMTGRKEVRSNDG